MLIKLNIAEANCFFIIKKSLVLLLVFMKNCDCVNDLIGDSEFTNINILGFLLFAEILTIKNENIHKINFQILKF